MAGPGGARPRVLDQRTPRWSSSPAPARFRSPLPHERSPLLCRMALVLPRWDGVMERFDAVAVSTATGGLVDPEGIPMRPAATLEELGVLLSPRNACASSSAGRQDGANSSSAARPAPHRGCSALSASASTRAQSARRAVTRRPWTLGQREPALQVASPAVAGRPFQGTAAAQVRTDDDFEGLVSRPRDAASKTLPTSRRARAAWRPASALCVFGHGDRVTPCPRQCHVFAQPAERAMSPAASRCRCAQFTSMSHCQTAGKRRR